MWMGASDEVHLPRGLGRLLTSVEHVGSAAGVASRSHAIRHTSASESGQLVGLSVVGLFLSLD